MSTLVQSKSATGTTFPIAVVFDSAVTAGNRIIMVVTQNGDNDAAYCDDLGGFTQADYDNHASNVRSVTTLISAAASGGETTFTANSTSTTESGQLVTIFEVSGLAGSVRGSTSPGGGSGASYDLGSIASVESGDFLVAAVASSSAINTAPDFSNMTEAGTYIRGQTAYAVAASTAAFASTFTHTTGGTPAMIGHIVAFTGDVADVTDPVISNLTYEQVSDVSVTITWTTDESATATVDYGTATGVYADQEPDPDDATTSGTSHGVVLSGLTPDTMYYARVRSSDAAANEAVSSEFTFRTAVAGGGSGVVYFRTTSDTWVQ